MNLNFSDIEWRKFLSAKYIIFFLVIVLILLKACTGSKSSNVEQVDNQKPASILVKNIIPSKHDVSIELTGYIESKNVIKLIPQTDGIVKEINIQQGSKVKVGDTILVLDEREKVAELKRAEQLVKQKRLELDINNKLLRNGDVSIVSNNQAKTLYNDALSQMEKAKSNLEFTKIKATISGYLDKVDVKKGDYVSAMNPSGIGSIFSDKSFIAVTQIPQIHIQQVKVGQKALVKIYGKEISGVLDFISNIANSGTRTYYSEVRLLTDENEFLSKMLTAPVTVKVTYDKVLAVKLKDSLVFVNDSGKLTLKVLDEDNRVKSIIVRLLGSDESGESLFGSDEFSGDSEIRVIARGAGFLSDGEKIEDIKFEE
jgi:RND family efflux transporter MFP subunit